MSFEWGGHCTIRDGVLNGTNASATICDCSIDVNSDEKLQLLCETDRWCLVRGGKGDTCFSSRPPHFGQKPTVVRFD